MRLLTSLAISIPLGVLWGLFVGSVMDPPVPVLVSFFGGMVIGVASFVFTSLFMEE